MQIVCAPCKVIGPKVKNMVLEKAEQLKSHENKFIYIEVDVDECFDLYAFLKSKKMVRGIPTFSYIKRKSIPNLKKVKYLFHKVLYQVQKNKKFKILLI